MSRPLFRPEALQARLPRLHGDLLDTALPWRGLWVGLSCALAVALAAFGLLGEVTSKEHVSGTLAPNAGILRIVAPQGGTITAVHVREGQTVRRGDVLVSIVQERQSAAGGDAVATVRRELAQRRAHLDGERAKQDQLDTLATQGLQQRLRALQTQAAQAAEQITLQAGKVASAERTVARQDKLMRAGFVSEAALQRDQELLMDQRNQLAALQRSALALQADAAATRNDLAGSELRRANNASALSRQISENEQQMAEAEARVAVDVTAPADGTVTTVVGLTGQSAAVGAPLMTVLPAGAQLQALLFIPSRAIGFLRTGQEVALRYQAFPYERFGHHRGHIVEIGRSALQPAETGLALAASEPVYRVTVALPAQTVQAYGAALALQPGMALDADISIDRRSVMHWVLDPLYAVTGRV